MSVVDSLVSFTRELASPAYGQVILGEGNTSGKDGENLWIKASGHPMSSITREGFVQVRTKELVGFLDAPKPSDSNIREFLNDSRVDQSSAVYPSTETLMHAWLLTLPSVGFVGHTHPQGTLSVMCGVDAERFAWERFFPDQIVLCGPRSVYVPYVAPGFELAVSIRERCKSFVEETGYPVKTVLLQNHGLIAVGASPNEVLSACLMMEKAAQVFLKAEDPHPLTEEEVAHIDNWSDEHFRQSVIWKE